MSKWQIVDEPEHDRVGITNSDIGYELYIPHWSNTRVETAHSPPQSGIHAEIISCHTKDRWTYSLTHINNTGGTATSTYLLEVWIEYCLVTKLQLPFTFGAKLRQKWLERSAPHR